MALLELLQNLLTDNCRIMKHTTYLIALCVLFTGCISELQEWGETPIKLSASSEVITRAGTDIQDGTFAVASGQVINAYITRHSDGAAVGDTPIELTIGDVSDNGVNELTPNVQTYYPNDNAIDIYAVYPASKMDIGSSHFEVEADQKDTPNYLKSDLMYAYLNNQVRTSSAVNLHFHHKMTKIIVSAQGKDGDGVNITDVKLINVSLGVAISHENGELNLGTLDEANGIVSLGTGGAALLPPQEINGDFIEVTVDAGNGAEIAKFALTNKKLEEGKEYSISVTVTRQQIGFTTAITDWKEDEGSVSVVPGATPELTIEDVPSRTYNGSEHTPEPKIWYGTNTTDENLLTLGTDYTLQYFKNINAGTATIVITGLSTSSINAVKTMTAVKTFTIKQATGNISYPGSNKSVEVDFMINGVVDNDIELNGGDGSMTFTTTNKSVANILPGEDQRTGKVTIVGVGECTIKAVMAGDKNYTRSEAEYKLKVKQRNASNFSVSLDKESFVYNGYPQSPVPTVTDKDADNNDITRVEGKDYTVSVANNTNVNNSVTVTITGINNYVGTNTSATFAITKATPVINMESDDMTMAVGFSMQRPASSDFGSVTLTSENEDVVKVTQAGDLTALKAGESSKIKATVEGTDNYNKKEVEYTVTVVDPNVTKYYTGDVQSWQCPVTGIYKLEVWGAEGASAIYTNPYGTTSTFLGGKGAYVSGSVKIEKDVTLYIYVGGKGEANGVGGWNGGGCLDVTAKSGKKQSGGGGATDISLANGVWNSDSHLHSRIIVAGGGGGALVYSESVQYANGGGGGAFVGIAGRGAACPGGGGRLNGPGAAGGTNAVAAGFGYGGHYKGNESVGMGGGGWYGGGSGGDNSTHGAGGGGSSYIWNAANASNYPGATPSTDFYVTELDKTEDTRSGNGQAKITYISVK